MGRRLCERTVSSRSGIEIVYDDELKIYRPELSNISPKARFGSGCTIHSHVWIGDVSIGNRVSIQAFAMLFDGLVVHDDVFIGPGVGFANDTHPPSGGKHWATTVVERGASIGMHASILAGVRIGAGAKIGMGAVVIRDVPEGALVVGNPARVVA